MEQPWRRKCRPCSSTTSTTSTAAPRTDGSLRPRRHRLRDRPEHRPCPGTSRRTRPLHKLGPPNRQQSPAAGARQPQGARERGQPDRDPRVGQGAGHRGKGPRPGPRRARGQVQGSDQGLADSPSPRDGPRRPPGVTSIAAVRRPAGWSRPGLPAAAAASSPELAETARRGLAQLEARPAAFSRSGGGAPARCGGGRRPECAPPRRARGGSPRGRRASSRA